MDKRIKTVWALSLILAAVATGVQTYFLYTQYEYVVDACMEERGTEILQLCDREHEIRKSEKKVSTSFFIQRNSHTTLIPGEADMVSNHQAMKMQFNYHDSVDVQENVRRDTIAMRLNFDSSIPEGNLQKGIAQAITERHTPFRYNLLDSLLGWKYRIEEWANAEGDTAKYYVSHIEKSGRALDPSIRVYYAYSPLEKKGVVIEADIPVQPVFKRMAIQLGLSMTLILILILCLFFQIKTILMQKKISELREHFVNTMIHELKRPVQALKTFLSFLNNEELIRDREAARGIIQDSLFETNNLSAYLNKLRDIIKADSGGTPLEKSAFDINELADTVVRFAQASAPKPVHISVHSSLEEAVEADRVHLACTLSNLIENSIKYSGSEVSIVLDTEIENNVLVISISDNGIGIPVSEQERVFNKFYRASNLPDKSMPGLGLGLSYVRLVAEAHRGSVSLYSNPGHGTTVTLRIPQ
jgi:two-component system phosphate regulon sensor histidine kinase PhoR